jgi:TRAP-type transport system small permease protein
MVSGLRKFELALASLLMAIVVILVFLAGVMRWFGYPLIWSVDVAQLLFVWVCFLGADVALSKRAHIGIDYFIRWLPAKPRLVLDLLLGVLVVAFLVAMAVLGWKLTAMNLERQFGDSGISYGFVTGAVPAGCLMLACTLLMQMGKAIKNFRSAPDPLFIAASGAGESL